MKNILSLLLLFSSISFAGLPPTSTQDSGDASSVTTFFWEYPCVSGTHTGVTFSLGIVAPCGGGTGIDSSSSTGVPVISSGTWSVDAQLPTSLGGLGGNFSSSTGALSISSGTVSAGVLPVSDGGTGTGTAFTPGSVIYAGASGVYSQDNANFFWDDTNHALNIATTNEYGELNVQQEVDGIRGITIFSQNGAQQITQGIENNGTSFFFNGSSVWFSNAGALNTFGSGGGNYHFTSEYADPNTSVTAPSIYAASAIQNNDSTAGNTETLFFGDVNVTMADIIAVNDSHTASAQAAHLDFGIQEAGTLTNVAEITSTGIGYGVGDPGQSLDVSGTARLRGFGTAGVVLNSATGLLSSSAGPLALTNGGTGNTTGTATVNANLTGPITSVGNATSVASQTGTGSTFVMNTSPTLVTPLLGTPTSGVATNLTGLPLTTGVTGTLPVTNGGTGSATALTQYGVTYAASSTAEATTAAGTANYPLVANSSAAPTFQQLGLTTGVTGVLPIANGGTDNSSLGVTAGGVVYTDGTKLQNTGAGTSGYVLESQGASEPIWVSSAVTHPVLTSGFASCTSGPCSPNIGNGLVGASGLSRTSAGIYSVTFATAFTSTPVCMTTVTETTVPALLVISGVSTTGITAAVLVNSTTGAAGDSPFNLMCQ